MDEQERGRQVLMTAVWSPTPVLQRLQAAAERFGGAADRIFDAIARDYPDSLSQRAAQLLRAADATAEDLDRLLSAAGFEDVAELRDRAERESGTRLAPPDLRVTKRDGGPGDRLGLRRIVDDEIENVADTLRSLQESGALELAARAILVSRRRWIFGDMKSANYASLLTTDLNAAFRDVTLIEPTSAGVLSALIDVQVTDTLTVFSFRNFSRLTLQVAREFRANGATVIALTDDFTSPIAEFADHILPINTRSTTMTHSPTAVTATGHVLASLAAAGAKGAQRRMDRRRELARRMGYYHDDAVRPADGG